MNTKEAKKAVGFCKIARSDGQGTVVRVPGHNGRVYFVLVTPDWSLGVINVTCRQLGAYECQGNSSSICYHALAAVLFLNPGAKLTESVADARNLSNLGGNALEINSTQSKRSAGIVLVAKSGRSARRERAEKVLGSDEIAEIARDYISLFSRVMEGKSLTEDEHERYESARVRFGALGLSHNEIITVAESADEDPDERIKRGKELLGREDLSEAI